ncbi:selenium cofactor biosynthesis protein YqeC [Thiohalorhabdus methylotrophus]|uniref:Selenium cofactor biosynthesis protein YqeC n=1 Tax=Thiohalorhabdus methylotrophus TaxID=3242694 RepID=A0ABV4TXD1_9GAMM
MERQNILDLLGARSGIVAFVGAGGKKTTIYRLADLHPGRVGVTTTVRITEFPADFEAERVIGEVADLAVGVPRAAGNSQRVAYALPPEQPGRLDGTPPELVRRLHGEGGFDATFVKADGARMRWVKCPRPGEPVLPSGTTTLVPIVSARGFGRPLDDRIAHRPERCAELLGMAAGETLRPEQLAGLLGPYMACRENREDLTVVPLINMVDDADLEEAARTAARAVLDRYPFVPRVVLGRMRSAEPLRAVVTR